MTEFTLHTVHTAADASKPFLQKAYQSLGFVPNLMALWLNHPLHWKATNLSATYSYRIAG